MFFLIDAALLLAVLILVCFDQYAIGAIAYLAAGAFAFYFIGAVHDFVSAAGAMSLAYMVGAYLTAGFVTSFFKWGFYMADFGKWISKKVDSFNLKTIDETAPDQKRKLFLQHLNDSAGEFGYDRNLEQFITAKNSGLFNSNSPLMTTAIQSDEAMVMAIAPKAMTHKKLITAWVFHWPWVIISMLIKNFVIELIQHFISMFSGVFGKIGQYFVRRATANLKL